MSAGRSVGRARPGGPSRKAVPAGGGWGRQRTTALVTAESDHTFVQGREGGGRLRGRTVDLDHVVEVPGHVLELVDEPLAVHLVQDAALVVVPAEDETPTSDNPNVK